MTSAYSRSSHGNSVLPETGPLVSIRALFVVIRSHRNGTIGHVTGGCLDIVAA
jgi:hypothetical protein